MIIHNLSVVNSEWFIMDPDLDQALTFWSSESGFKFIKPRHACSMYTPGKQKQNEFFPKLFLFILMLIQNKKSSSGSSEKFRIQPEPDPVRIHNTELFIKFNFNSYLLKILLSFTTSYTDFANCFQSTSRTSAAGWVSPTKLMSKWSFPSCQMLNYWVENYNTHLSCIRDLIIVIGPKWLLNCDALKAYHSQIYFGSLLDGLTCITFFRFHDGLLIYRSHGSVPVQVRLVLFSNRIHQVDPASS